MKITLDPILSKERKVDDFTESADTPSSFTGAAGKFLRVNAGELELEFYEVNTVSNFLGLDDTPSSFSGQALKKITVNAAENAFEFTEDTGIANGWDPTYAVSTFADLPAFADHQGECWLVNNVSGSWYTFNSKPKGIYKAEVTEWNYKGRKEDAIPKEHDYYVTANNWADLVTNLESGDYADIRIPDGTYTCTNDEATPIVVHANVKRITGQSRNGVIIDVNGSVNTAIQDFMTVGVDCVIENIWFDNIGTGGTYYTIKGTCPIPWGTITKVINCKFTNVCSAGGRLIGYSDVFSCIAINPSSVGIYGRGVLAYGCRSIVNCRTEYIQNLAKASYNIINNFVYKCNAAVETSCVVDNNYITSCYRGMYNCALVGKGNYITNFGDKKYHGCTFNNTERDNADNTKELTHDYSKIATGTERTVEWQNNNGQVVLSANSITPAANSDLVIEKTNNTTLTFKLKGSDGNVKSGTLALS